MSRLRIWICCVAVCWLVSSLAAFAVEFYMPFVKKGEQLPASYAKSCLWSKGVLELANDPLRGRGLRSDVNGNPNDRWVFEYFVARPEDVQQLIDLFAKIDRPRRKIVLDPSLGPAQRPQGLGLSRIPPQPDVVFYLGMELELRDLPGGALYRRVPDLVPTLFLYVGNEEIQLERLKVSEGIEVTSHILTTDRGDLEKQIPIARIEQWLADRKVRLAEKQP